MTKPTQILLIEDDATDVWFLEEAVRESGWDIHLHTVWEGEQALCYLKEAAGSDRERMPDLIFLDLNLPSKSGLEVLCELKADDALRKIPVIILSHSQCENDIENTYQHQASAFLNKPVPAEEFREIVRYQNLFKPPTSPAMT